MRDIAVIAFAQLPNVREDHEREEVELVQPVVAEAIEKAGLQRKDIGFTVSGSSDYLLGRPFSFVTALDAVAPWPPISESHVEMDGVDLRLRVRPNGSLQWSSGGIPNYSNRRVVGISGAPAILPETTPREYLDHKCACALSTEPDQIPAPRASRWSGHPSRRLSTLKPSECPNHLPAGFSL